MLRSFAYAASAAELDRGVEPPDNWEELARDAFLGGYQAEVDPNLIPSGSSPTGCSPCSSWRRPCTSSATSSTTGPTGCASRWRDPERLLERARVTSSTFGELDVYLAREGKARAPVREARRDVVTDGVTFAVWAPSAQHVALVGDFNGWDSTRRRCRTSARPASGRRVTVERARPAVQVRGHGSGRADDPEGRPVRVRGEVRRRRRP